MKDAHLTLRLPAVLARSLARWARAHNMPKSHVVREAVAHYLARYAPAPEVPTVLTARNLADRWRLLPRLRPDEASEFAVDIATARHSLPPLADSWE